FEVLKNFRGKHIFQERSTENLRAAIVSGVGMKHPQQRLVDVSYAPPGIKREHASGNAFENGFHLTTALVEFGIGRAQFTAGSLELATAAFEILRHAVERTHQIANFVGC